MTTLGPIAALGTRWYIELFEPVLDEAVLTSQIHDYLLAFEYKFSRFKADSLLTKLNQSGQLTDADDETLNLFTKALEMYEATHGVFNIAVGAELEAVGYNAAYAFTHTEALKTERPKLPEVLTVDEATITVAGAQLDLGGIGKGFLIDRLAEHLLTLGHRYFVINGGGDMYISSDHGEPVEIILAHPQDMSRHIGSVALKDQGFAASSPYVRAWKDKVTGEARNHLLTDKTIASYTVAADTTTADVWATALAVEPELREPVSISTLLLDGTTVLRSDPCFVLYT